MAKHMRFKFSTDEESPDGANARGAFGGKMVGEYVQVVE